MTYLLATTEDKVRWYAFDREANGRLVQPLKFYLIEELDLKKVELFADKATAKNAAVAAGLKTWKYFQF
jgi:hypothetical protein